MKTFYVVATDEHHAFHEACCVTSEFADSGSELSLQDARQLRDRRAANQRIYQITITEQEGDS